MRLIHYSDVPLTKVRSRRHDEGRAGAYKTAGLWVSVEGEHDWLSWCRGEQWGLDRFIHATEVVLVPNANVKVLSGAAAIDDFTEQFQLSGSPVWHRGLDWPAIRRQWHGLIIAPYCWERRLSDLTSWYYGWDCASGVIWDARAVEEVRPLPAPDLTAVEEAA
jgi:hypothetical protein